HIRNRSDSTIFHNDPQICIFKIATVVFNNIRAIALLHERNFYNNLLKISIYRYLFNSDHLLRFLMQRFVDATIGAFAQFANNIENFFRLSS
ncbi:hypothetical protein QE152_g41478, partial [Popillia japonica]